MRRGLLLMGAALALAPGARARAQSQPSSPAPALTLAEVLELRRSGVPTAQILQSAREYCVAFVVADSSERELRAAGADSLLLTGLRAACRPAGVASAATSPVTLQVDDDFRKVHRLPVSTLRTQACRSRYDTEGYYLSSEDTQLGCTLVYPAADLSGDFRIELNVIVLNGADATVALGFWRDGDSWDRWSFNVQGNGRFELCRFQGTRCLRILPFTSATNVWRRASRVENTLAVERRGRLLRLFINGAKVAESIVEIEPSGDLVLGVGPRSSVLFRSLRVTRPTA